VQARWERYFFRCSWIHKKRDLKDTDDPYDLGGKKMKYCIRKKLEYTLSTFSTKSFRECIALAAACFLVVQVIWNPFSKDVFLKLIAALFFFLGFISTNEFPQKICTGIGIVFYFLLILNLQGGH
jgi:hypothetical protein